MLVELSEVLGTSYDELNNVAHSINGSSQLIITLGNNDLPEDYVMQEWDHWASKLYHLWTPHIVPPNSENQKVGHPPLMILSYHFASFRHSSVACITGHSSHLSHTFVHFA